MGSQTPTELDMHCFKTGYLWRECLYIDDYLNEYPNDFKLWLLVNSTLKNTAATSNGLTNFHL